MQVRIQHKKIQPSINMLYQLPLKGTKSRHRSKFIKLLDARLSEVAEQERDIVKEHCHVDDEGNPKVKKMRNDVVWDVKSPESVKAFRADREELYEEELVVEGDDNAKTLEIMKMVLTDCDEEFSAANAEAYDYLCDQFGVDE